jgi:hypothetical protein
VFRVASEVALIGTTRPPLFRSRTAFEACFRRARTDAAATCETNRWFLTTGRPPPRPSPFEAGGRHPLRDRTLPSVMIERVETREVSPPAVPPWDSTTTDERPWDALRASRLRPRRRVGILPAWKYMRRGPNAAGTTAAQARDSARALSRATGLRSARCSPDDGGRACLLERTFRHR